MNSQQIETFLAIVETKNIAHAAENLFLSQPSVSYRLKSLENELGFALIERSQGQRNIKLTSKGKAFINIAASWMKIWQDIQLLSAEDTKFPISIASPKDLNPSLISLFFKQTSSELQIFDSSLILGSTSEICDAVFNDRADVGFIFENTSYKGLNIEPFYKERMVLVKECTDINEIRTAYHPSELNASNEIYFNLSSDFAKWHDQWFGSFCHPYVSISKFSLLKMILNDPELWAIVPASIQTLFPPESGIKTYELVYPPDDLQCYRVTKRAPREDRRRNIQVFIDRFKQYIDDSGFASII